VDNKKLTIFVLGFLAGACFIFLLVIIPVYLNRGSELKDAKNFGNVTITPIGVDDKNLLGIGGSLMIQKDEEPILVLYFDYNKKFTDLSFLRDNKPLFSASWSQDFNKWSMYSFGYYELGLTYFDKNCDGCLDDMDINRTRTSYIFSDNTWLKVDESKGGNARIGSGSSVQEYIFSSEKGWIKK